MRTEKELLILLRKELVKIYNTGDGYLYLCFISERLFLEKLISKEDYIKLNSLISNNKRIFIDKFNGIDDNGFWMPNDFHNRYQALNYLIDRYEQKEHMTVVDSLKEIIINIIKKHRRWGA